MSIREQSLGGEDDSERDDAPSGIGQDTRTDGNGLAGAAEDESEDETVPPEDLGERFGPFPVQRHRLPLQAS